MPAESHFSPYLTFNRDEWRRLRNNTPLPLTEADLIKLRGINEDVSLEEVSEVYLPLSRLLDLYVTSSQDTYSATKTFLGHPTKKVPYIIGIAGSVAVGKSTTSRILQALLARWPHHPKVDLVTTDSFLYPNRVLEERGLMKRKGFPESYNVRKLLQFLIDVKSGRPEVSAPVYSHLAYDIVPGHKQTIHQPDIVIIEGLNVLQTGESEDRNGRYIPPLFVSDLFDFSIYVDAKEEHIEQWYIDRFKVLQRTAFSNPDSYFHRYADLSDEEATETARQIWREINGLNLRTNILPTKWRAQLILSKGEDHSVESIKLRKL